MFFFSKIKHVDLQNQLDILKLNIARNRISTEVKSLLVRVYEDPIEDYLALAGTLGATNHLQQIATS